MRNSKSLLRVLGVMSFAVATMAACGDDSGGDDDDPIDAATTPIDAGDTPTQDCATYCDTVMANCTAAVGQYPDRASCEAACATFPEGTAADTSGNTLGCRIYHAGAADGAPDVHCPHAGPGGAGLCGTNCEGFCQIALAECDAIYADAAECMTDCALFADDEPFDVSDTSGDSLACRLYHLVVATGTPAPHCTHISSDSPTCAP